MNYNEALRTLGLDEGATEADIKVAYKEMAQILHPDKVKGNKRLEERSTELFKRISEAKEVLLNSRTASAYKRTTRAPGSRSAGSQAGGAYAGSARGSGAGAYAQTADYSPGGSASTIKAKLAGIAAARTQLMAQLDSEKDRRRIGIYLIIGGIIAMIVGTRIHIIEPLGGVALVWGAVQFFSTQANIKVIKQNLARLKNAREKYEKDLENI